MTRTLIQQLADFSADTTFASLPPAVVQECKRALLDSIGCAIAATDEPKGRAGIDYGRIVGAGNPQATIMGTGDKVSVLGAAFANGELINALDMDAVLPPGHVSPYVMPAALALAESVGSSGQAVITSMAVAHEMSNRFGKAMDNQRKAKADGRPDPPPVFGYAAHDLRRHRRARDAQGPFARDHGARPGHRRLHLAGELADRLVRAHAERPPSNT